MKLVNRAKRVMAREMARGTEVTLRWSVFEGEDVDPTTGANLGARTAQSEVVRGLVHAPSVPGSAVHLFQNYEEGDLLVDLPPETVIDGRAELRVEVDGILYEPKKVGDVPSRHHEIVSGIRICRTLLLRKAT